MKGPLEGIKVVELATMIAAPSCGQLLAQLGAEVIKLEPLTGEPYRGVTYCAGKEPVIFDTLNAGKKSVAINAKNSENAAAIKKVIEGSDVFLSNIRTDALKRLGLDYESLKYNEKLVYAHFSGYGPKGPLADLPGFDGTAFFARSGVYRDFTDPDHEPANHVSGFGDMICGLVMTVNVLSALMGRAHTGKGINIDNSLNQTAAWVFLLPMVYEQFGSWFRRKENDPLDLSSASVRCRDGEYIYFNIGTQKQWRSFWEAIGTPYLISDPRCATGFDVLENTDTLYKEIAPIFLQHSAEEWVQILRDHDVPCERHRHMSEMATDEQLIANGFIQKREYHGKSIMVSKPPIEERLTDSSLDIKGAPLGMHTKQVLMSAGCSEEDIQRLAEAGEIILYKK